MKLILIKKHGVWMWAGFTWLRRALVVGSYEQGNESSSSIRGKVKLVKFSLCFIN
jgi:hypothetical protein